LALIIILFSCSQDTEQLPNIITPKNTQASIDKFSGLGQFLTNYVGSKNDQIDHPTELNNGGTHPLIERINFDRVMARLDESGHTYMSMVIRNDNPLVIQNLVIGKGIDGDYQRPMIFTYTMTKSFYQNYLNTGSLKNFEGTVHRVNLDPNQISHNENVANMALGNSANTSCEDQSSLGGKDQDPNTHPDESPNSGGGSGPSGAGCTYEMETVFEEVEEFVTYYEEINGQLVLTTDIIYSTREVDKMVMTCDEDWANLNSSDNMCENPNNGELPILLPKISLDSTLVALPCASNIIKSFYEQNTLFTPVNNGTISQMYDLGITGELLEFFNSSPVYNLKFQVGDAGKDKNGNNRNASTIWKNGVIKITLDDIELANATDVSIARTIIHETMHGYIQAALYTSNLDPNIRTSITTIYNQLQPKKQNRGLAEHEFISDYVHAMAFSLSAWDNNSNQRYLGMDYYKNLSWGGLFETNGFNSLTSTQQRTIEKNVLSELKNKADAVGSTCN